jgi:transcriptional regulator MraZ
VAFRGTFELTLDAKNRLTVPAKLRAALAEGVVLAKGVERNVGIWKPEDYESQIQATLAGQNPMSPQARELRRFFSSGAFDTELDAAGRVMVPAFLVDHAALDRDVVVTGAGDCLEVWDRAAWRDYEPDLTNRITDITASLDTSP